MIKEYKPKWTEQELQYLKDNCHRGITAVAKELGRSYHAVVQKLYKHRLSSTGKTLKEISINPKIQVKTEWCRLPPFDPIMIALYPNAIEQNARIWGYRRRIILKMHDYCCHWCGDEANTVDHVLARIDGGTDERSNLVAACQSCNSEHAGRVKSWQY